MTNSLDMLCEAASRLRLGIPCVLADENPCLGGSHRVFKIIFEDSVQWAARASDDSLNWENELRAVRQFRHIKKQRPKLKAPDLFVDKEYPVVYSEWVSGKPLGIWNLQLPLIKRQRLLDDLAEFLLQLWTTPVLSALAQEKSCLYSTWLTESLDRGLWRTLKGTARWGNVINFLIMRSMIPDHAAEYDGYSSISFAHGDLHACNIMKSEEFHLTGVIDWDWMFVAPLPASIHHPWFIADIPGWHNAGVSESESFEVDRRYLENSIREKEMSQHLPLTVSTLLSDSSRRLFFHSAFHYKDIHEEFVRIHCPWTDKNIKAAMSQLDAALRLYPELAGEEGVREVKDLLRRSEQQGQAEK